MPIPTYGPWPPPTYAPAYDAYRDWDAWYTGSADRLRDVYAGRGSTDQRLRPSQRHYPGQHAGGIIGRFSRWLWGTPSPADRRDGRLHIPLPADLAATSANLLFSEPPALTHPDTNVTARLEQLQSDGLATVLLHAAEAASALGDVYLRPVIDRDVYPDRALLTAVHADGALPTIRWGHILEVTFWSTVLVDGPTHLRLLEHHDVTGGAGRITYALHQGTLDQLGRPIPYTEHPDTAYLAALVDETGAQDTGLDRLDVVRIPNAGPQRLWRTVPGLKYLGRSDFDGAEPLFDRLDEVWTSWMRDIRLAKARITVPDTMLQAAGPGQGAFFDADREVYSALNTLPKDMAGGLTVTQFAIRHVEHKATADALVDTVLRHAGLSAQTVGTRGDVQITATEVQSNERQSFATRGNRIQPWRPGIADAVHLLLTVEQAKLGAQVGPVRPNVEFGDSVSESPETTARTVQMLAAAEAVSIETRIRMVHPEWGTPEVTAEVQRIRDDMGGGPPPADTLNSLAGQEATGG